MNKFVKKCENCLKGEIVIPPDKSISHRAVILSSLANGKCIITNFSQGADSKSTVKLYQNLGVNIKYVNENTLEINSTGKLTPNSNENICFCGNSGTTMRLSAGVLAGQNFSSVLTGDESLSKRPMKRIIEPLNKMNADICGTDNHAPIFIKGKKLSGIDYVSQNASAQVKSCVLLAGLNAEGKTSYTEPFLSRNHTEKMLEYLGTDIETNNTTTIITPSELYAKDIEIVGDISSAAFFIVAALIVPNSKILIKNVGINSTRTGILDVIKRMGGNIEILNERTISNEEVGDISVCYTENLKACEISGQDIPKLVDELPVIAILATQCEGQTIVKNAEDLRNKEADRIHCLVSELQKIGADIVETNDGFIITGKSVLKGNTELQSYKDHRLAMSFYIAGLICQKDIYINDFEWINISFPEFEQLISSLL